VTCREQKKGLNKRRERVLTLGGGEGWWKDRRDSSTFPLLLGGRRSLLKATVNRKVGVCSIPAWKKERAASKMPDPGEAPAAPQQRGHKEKTGYTPEVAGERRRETVLRIVINCWGQHFSAPRTGRASTSSRENGQFYGGVKETANQSI